MNAGLPTLKYNTFKYTFKYTIKYTFASFINLFTVLRNDLSSRNLFIDNLSELNEIRDIARCRKCWQDLSEHRLQF